MYRSKGKVPSVLMFWLLLATMVLMYQNCGRGFQVSKKIGEALSSQPDGNTPDKNLTEPEPPSLPIDIISVVQEKNVANVKTVGGHGFIASGRSTTDGRIYIDSCGLFYEPSLCFGIIKPEVLDSRFQSSGQVLGPVCNSAACKITKETVRAVANRPNESATINWNMAWRQMGLCDAPLGRTYKGPLNVNSQFGPTACGSNNSSDCYEFQVQQVLHKYNLLPGNVQTLESEVWSLKVTVVVSNAKTESAAIQSVDVISAQKLALPSSEHRSFIEPSQTSDGHLLFWHSINEIKYSMNELGACRPDGWRVAKKIGDLYMDPALKNAGVPIYPIAAQPFRDYENVLISKTTAQGTSRSVNGAYPWIDRNGANLVLLSAGRPLHYINSTLEIMPLYSGAKYADCDTNNCNFDNLNPFVPDQSCRNLPAAQIADCLRNVVYSKEATLPRTGVTVGGAWTNGKFIAIDNRINNNDFNTKMNSDKEPAGKYDVILPLYQNTDVRLGSSQITFINSIENVFNFQNNMRSRTPADVVWDVLTPIATDEIIFDNYIDRQSFIIAHMNASISFERLDYNDGFEHIAAPISNSGPLVFGKGFTQIPHVQNAATAPESEWKIPSYGALVGGARIEPIAAGGIIGKGIWLDGADDAIEFTIPQQSNGTKITNSDWFYSMWIDSRDLPGPLKYYKEQLLLETPDGSKLYVIAEDLLIVKLGNKQFVINLPVAAEMEKGKFSHLAIVSSPNRTTKFYWNGQLVVTFTTDLLFRMGTTANQVGTLRIGSYNSVGFKGWVDEFVVLARAPNPEIICNYAYGTLIKVPNFLAAQANYVKGYEASIAEINGFLPVNERAPAYLCESTRVPSLARAGIQATRCASHFPKFSEAPQPGHCIRPIVLFPEGPLYADSPRPNSVNNQTCLMCHTNANPTLGLRLPALAPLSVLKPLDLRRQPTEPHPKVFGAIPDGYFEGSASSTPGGVLIDPLILPNHP